MRIHASVLLAAVLCTCSSEPATPSGSAPAAGPVVPEDPRLACVREHPVDAAYAPVVRALCAEHHGLDGVSASVAIALDGEVVFSTAVGPRCHGQGGPLHPTTALGIGSITKLVTTALVLAVAQQQGIGLDTPIDVLPPSSIPPTLRGLMTHTSGLRDVDSAILVARGDEWPEVLAAHRERPGEHVYANANYLVLGRWLEQTTGKTFAELYASEPTVAAAHGLVSVSPPGDVELGCGHRRQTGWEAIEPTVVTPLPAFTVPAGGGIASVEQLVRLPSALEASGMVPRMTQVRGPSDKPDWEQGLGVRLRGRGEGLVLGHSGNTGTYWAELQWSPRRGVSVAVMSTTPQAYKATLHAAFAAALAVRG